MNYGITSPQIGHLTRANLYIMYICDDGKWTRPKDNIFPKNIRKVYFWTLSLSNMDYVSRPI